MYIKGNLRLVLSVIRRFQNSSENPDDLFQIGCIGLIKAIDNFDTTLQVKFSTYAVPMIIGEIRRYLRDNNSIRVSRSLRDIAYKTIYTRENYMRQHLKEPTIAEIADEIGIDKEMIVYAMDAIQSPVSLFEPVYSEGGDTLYVMDQISDKKNLEENWVEDISLRDAMNRLGERERHIIDLRFYEGKTQMEVADEIGISQAQVSRLENMLFAVCETISGIDSSLFRQKAAAEYLLSCRSFYLLFQRFLNFFDHDPKRLQPCIFLIYGFHECAWCISSTGF